MKKFKLVITFIILICITISSVACKTDKKEVIKFEGKLSKQAFETLEDATNAYFNEQIKGGDYEGCEYRGYDFKKELTKSEKNALNLGDVSVNDVIHAERGKVGFTYGSEVFLNTVYIVQTKEGYHYYTLESREDEAVCYDYYEFLVSDDVLNNVTVKTSSMIIKEEGHSRQTEIVMEYRYTENGTQYEIVTREFFNGGISESTRRGYILKSEDDFAVYGINDKGEYVEVTESYLELISTANADIHMVSVVSNLYMYGHNLFKVNEKVFILRNIEVEKLSKYFQDLYYGENQGSVKNLSYTMSVASQKIVSTSANIYSVDTSEMEKSYINIETSFSKYGETEITIPDEVVDLWNNRWSRRFME